MFWNVINAAKNLTRRDHIIVTQKEKQIVPTQLYTKRQIVDIVVQNVVNCTNTFRLYTPITINIFILINEYISIIFLTIMSYMVLLERY